MMGKVEHKNHLHLLLGAMLVAFVVIALLRIFNRRGIVKIEEKVEALEHAREESEAEKP